MTKKSDPKPVASGGGKSTKTTAAKAAARNTAGGPSHPSRGPQDDLPSAKAAGTQALAAALTHNANKPLEHGRENAMNPPEGQSAEPESPLVTGSTLSERNPSAKVGEGKPSVGENATIASLDRARADASGQVLTTNQGVQVADNQNSLKAGLRGPALLEDFILREKITHFDHERIPERVVHSK